MFVTLYTRVWIEIDGIAPYEYVYNVTLYTRVWIEMCYGMCVSRLNLVTLYTRVWIEIMVTAPTNWA